MAYGIGPGSTIWYDLEGFDLTNTHCRESALVFTSAWVTRIKALGYVAGFYSSASSGIKMLDDARLQRPGQFALPDRIWIARWDGAANTSTTYIGEDGWRPGGRMKQYRGGHNETWGGVTINIDSNFIDLGAGSVARPEGRCPGTRLGYWKYPTLSPGAAQPTRVKVLQCLLTEQGTYSGPLSGAYDAATVAAARAWQASRRFTPSDTFEKRHWTALLAAGPRTTIKRGSVDESVHRLQRALNAAGAGRFRASGVFDAKTETALRAYQSRLRIAVSGVATPADLEQAAARALRARGASDGRAHDQRDARQPGDRQQRDDQPLGRPAQQPGGGLLEEAVRRLGAQAPGVAEQPGALGVPLEGHGGERRDRRGQAQREPADRPALVDPRARRSSRSRR